MGVDGWQRVPGEAEVVGIAELRLPHADAEFGPQDGAALGAIEVVDELQAHGHAAIHIHAHLGAPELWAVHTGLGTELVAEVVGMVYDAIAVAAQAHLGKAEAPQVVAGEEGELIMMNAAARGECADAVGLRMRR